jgi:hypothetical protein
LPVLPWSPRGPAGPVQAARPTMARSIIVEVEYFIAIPHCKSAAKGCANEFAIHQCLEYILINKARQGRKTPIVISLSLLLLFVFIPLRF